LRATKSFRVSKPSTHIETGILRHTLQRDHAAINSLSE
jgi:hypothetical protein